MKILELGKENTSKNIEESLKLLGIEDLKADEQYVVLDEIVKYVFDTNQIHF